ncbi:Retron-type RNA-directed DNA polymerase [Carbonactinospora thermoautotrophica]|uniref:Retron-type RNA-directed DNA polymerase n=1 Tax=Carbonactinospora thermoautotrophica TaxID=1469144 RepID=A0A132MSU1_9ACTN|nr:reverse transcriptase domain-containing protein [Carbonactinospora thermoautotrophica]KWX00937.1 Retron-type RNA-directed DNA polymerase [Carbonactinospora thermoautotrophica]
MQASLKLVLEPIFEADFHPCSSGFRPMRRAHDAIAETRTFATKGYHWVVEGDVQACFDSIDHTALMRRMRRRVGDKRVLALVKAFLKAGILTEDGADRDTRTGTPQGGILSPLLANIALSVLDEFFAETWARHSATYSARRGRRRRGLSNWRLVRYADDFLVLVFGTREHAEAIRDQVGAVLAPMGLRLSAEKTKITHIDEGLDFLRWRVQRHRKRGTTKRHIYTYPAKKALRAVTATVKALCCQDVNRSLAALIWQLNRVLRGWTAYFRAGVSNATFEYLRAYTWRRVIAWIRRKHRRISWKEPRRRYCPDDGWWPRHREAILFNPGAVCTTHYRYRGTAIPSPGRTRHEDLTAAHHGTCGKPDARKRARPVWEGGPGKRTDRKIDTAPRADPTRTSWRRPPGPGGTSPTRSSTSSPTPTGWRGRWWRRTTARRARRSRSTGRASAAVVVSYRKRRTPPGWSPTCWRGSPTRSASPNAWCSPSSSRARPPWPPARCPRQRSVPAGDPQGPR